MIDVKRVRENPDELRESIKSRNINVDVDALLSVDKKRLEVLKKVEDVRAKKRQASDKIAAASPTEKKGLITDMKQVDVKAKKQEKELKALDEEFQTFMQQLPNFPSEDTPVGADESDNVEVKIVGKPTRFRFEPKDSLTLGTALDIIDVERAGKVSGSRFGYLKGAGALLELALVQYAMQLLTSEGFVPIIPPVMIKEEMMRAMGFLAHGGEAETYHLKEDDLYLVGTSEQSVVPMHANETFDEDELPRRYVAYSTCFRREAGSYGKDTRGILRVHQFDKIEALSITTPEKADEEHAYLLSLQERLMTGLKLPYRVVKLCTGDLGYPAARTYDIETWMPSENTYRETHSISTTTDYQSRALKIRVKRSKGKAELVHILNGTVFSQRPILAIIENFQEVDGSVSIPDVLQPYMHGITKIKAQG